MCYNRTGDDMKKNEYINVRVNEKVKEEAENIFKDLGLKMSDAINIFLNQVCVEKGLPFEVKLPKFDESYKALEKAIAYNAFGGGKPSKYALNILKLYAKEEIDYETALFALEREKHHDK